MQFNNKGEMIFDDEFELTYEILNEMELELRPDGTIYDRLRNKLYYFNGMLVKASTNPHQMHYAGQGEIAFDILHNVRMATVMFGNYLQNCQADGMEFVSWFQEERESPEIEGAKMTNLSIKKDSIFVLESPFFYNKCLKFIWCLFHLQDTRVDLSNFDTIPQAEGVK